MRRGLVLIVVIAMLGVTSGGSSSSVAQETEADLLKLYQHPPGLGPEEAIARVSASTLSAFQAERAASLSTVSGTGIPAGVNVRTTNSAGTQAEISMAATGGGGQNIVITYNGGPNGLGFVSSQNGGSTFQAEQSPPTAPGSNPCCDPSIVADNGTNFYLIQLFRDDGANAPNPGNCTNSLHVSTNGGQAFSNIVSSPFSYAPGTTNFPDMPHIGIDRANPNNLYVFTRHFTSGINCPQTGGSGTVQGEIVCSSDGGATWSNPFVFPQFTDTAHIDVAPNGTAYVVGNGIGTNAGTTRVILWRSTATACPGAGNTPNFAGPTVAANNLTFGNVGIDREFPQPTALADPTNSNRVYVNFSADSAQGSGDREAFLSRCDFPAGTCTALLTVNDNPADGTAQYFPMACIDPATNNVFVSWNDARTGQQAIRATTVTNNGTTTGTSRQVSDVTWPIINPGGSPDYGDYNDNNGACRARHHYAAWSSQVSPPGILPASTSIDVFFTVVNEPPLAIDDTLVTEEDTPGSVNVLANDSDPDGDPLTVTSLAPSAANGLVVCTAAGLCTYTPDLNFNGSDSFVYTVSDGAGGTTSATVHVTVNPVYDLDHFNCYGVKGKGFKPRPRVALSDRFHEERVVVGTPDVLCNPVDKRHGEAHEDIDDPSAHLTCYEIRDVGKFPRFSRREIEIENQFGSQTLKLKEPSTLCLPSSKSAYGQNPGPPPKVPDHFKCYSAKGKRLSPRPRVVLTDQFGTVEVSVSKPVLFCTPVDKNGEGIQDPAHDLTCYTMDTSGLARRSVVVGHQFGSEKLRVKRARTLCVPTEDR